MEVILAKNNSSIKIKNNENERLLEFGENIIVLSDNIKYESNEIPLYYKIQKLIDYFAGKDVLNIASDMFHYFGCKNTMNAKMLIAGYLGKIPYVFLFDLNIKSLNLLSCGKECNGKIFCI